ncbi:serine hydrolase domain-containing protein [Aestuariispira insulae]|uniref:CubicO group peptidase (Beta-lactamase class C family) n=1 Tax=Aestuariispira insulae TaxID=1461337 RepID=A0A3D9H3W6_9PROT|nr:serine hydrolase domain-containing protein [Aestuariispira insulae]RED44185.1 CubicO group peptidase (beta-lactamase class C family) [Aestuariispira insulae]
METITKQICRLQGQVTSLQSGLNPLPEALFQEEDGAIRLRIKAAGHALMASLRCNGESLVDAQIDAGGEALLEVGALPAGQQVLRLHCQVDGALAPVVTHIAYVLSGDLATFRHERQGDPLVDAIGELLEKWDLPGGVMASAQEKGEIQSTAIGWADAAAGVPLNENHRFRAASLGKVITTASIYQLVEQGSLSLDIPVAEALGMSDRHAAVFEGASIKHLLRMSCGVQVDSATGAPSPLEAGTLAEKPDLHSIVSRDWLEQVLDTAQRHFTPGEKFDYHTDNYWLLGRIIEQVSGISYADYVIRNIFQPLGLNDICLATTFADGRHPDEVIYHEGDCPPEAPQAAMGVEGMVPAPYQRVMPIRDAMGGWLVTAAEMVKLNQHLTDLAPSLVNEASLEGMLGREGAAPMPTEWYYGDGLFVQNPAGRGLTPQLVWWHFGLVPGCSGLLARIRGRHISLLVNGAPVKQNIFLATLWRVVLKAVGR